MRRENWAAAVRAELLKRRDRLGAWGYRDGTRPAVEPTALVCLGLLTSAGDVGDPIGDLVRGGAAWQAAVQRRDGALEAADSVSVACWPTSYALLLWSRLPGHDGPTYRAATWLLADRGRPIADSPADGRPPIFGHDLSLVGWPWIDGTTSWLEPTALAVLALCCTAHGEHPRVREGLRLIGDRALPGGGWNYGNRSVFGRTLRPQPGPTGLALVALAHSQSRERTPAVEGAIRYLCEVLPSIRAPISLGWGVLGLRSWGACPDAADAWLAASQKAHAARANATAGLGLLLMASRPGPPFADHKVSLGEPSPWR